jgi:hypothetical protein
MRKKASRAVAPFAADYAIYTKHIQERSTPFSASPAITGALSPKMRISTKFLNCLNQ